MSAAGQREGSNHFLMGQSCTKSYLVELLVLEDDVEVLVDVELLVVEEDVDVEVLVDVELLVVDDDVDVEVL